MNVSMLKTRFLIRDYFSAEIAKYISGLLTFLILAFLLMSFTTNDGNIKTGKSNISDTLSTIKFQNLLSSNDNIDPDFIPLNAQAISFTNSFIDRQSDAYDKMKSWGKPYFNLFDKILSSNGLPLELKYLSVIESDLRGNLVSGAGAVGPWQLMPDEAKRFHLKINGDEDQRTNFALSTQVACNLLKELHNEFGDWLLTIAAYNCGAGRVKEAIAKAGSNNFWKLQYFLPEETRNHVKKYIATDFYFEKTGGFTTMTADEIADFLSVKSQKNNDNLDSINTSTVTINGKYKAAVIAQNLSMSASLFNALNPDFDKIIATGADYTLRLPAGKIADFKTQKQNIIRESVQSLFATSK